MTFREETTTEFDQRQEIEELKALNAELLRQLKFVTNALEQAPTALPELWPNSLGRGNCLRAIAKAEAWKESVRG